MRFIELLVLHLYKAITSFFQEKNRKLPEVLRLEEGFFHDLKGIYNKRLGLPINKFRSGNNDVLIKENITKGAEEVVKRFGEVRRVFFDLFAPDRKLLQLYLDVYHLEKTRRLEDTSETVQALEQVKERAFQFYQLRVTESHFELGALLDQLVAIHKAAQGKSGSNVEISFNVSDQRHRLRLPYFDYGVWRRIFDNVIINAIEAVEMTGHGGKVSVALSYPDPHKARVAITDTGVGMDERTLAAFTTRGFTSGKLQGQGLGINEDVVAFVNQRGRFEVKSKQGEGTSIEIEVDADKISGADARKQVLPRQWLREIKLASTLTMLAIIMYGLLAIPYQALRFWRTLPPEIARAELSMPDSAGATSFAALDKIGDTIWTTSLSPYYVSDDNINQICRPLVDDFSGDGRNEVVYTGQKNYKTDSLWTGYVACVGDFKREIWKHLLGPNSTLTAFGLPEIQYSEFAPRALRLLKRRGREPGVVVIATADNYPCQIQLLDCDGSIEGEYWHTGHLALFGDPKDFDGDGKTEIVLYGENNRLGWSLVIIMLDLDSLRGQSPPYLETLLKQAREKLTMSLGILGTTKSPVLTLIRMRWLSVLMHLASLELNLLYLVDWSQSCNTTSSTLMAARVDLARK